jgi:hypothetical protein
MCLLLKDKNFVQFDQTASFSLQENSVIRRVFNVPPLTSSVEYGGMALYSVTPEIFRFWY